MSAPTKQFHRLSIGRNMPGSRAQARTAHAAGPPGSSDDDNNNDGGKNRGSDDGDSSLSERSSDEGRSEEENRSQEQNESAEDSDSDDASNVLARSGITYDLDQLDSETEARAIVGLTGQFDVANCRATPTGYAFQLSTRPQVHLGRDSYTCTCSNSQGRPGMACQHIFWILDQLHGCFLTKAPPKEVALSRDGRSRELPRIEGLLEGKLETVASRLNWQFLRTEGDGRGTGMTRAEKARDILSAFDPVTLPEDFRADLVETTAQARTAEQCVVQGDFEATMFRLAVHDDGVFSSLCKAMPAGACAAIYFDKVQEQSRTLLADFDRYCATGERANSSSPGGGGTVDVSEVASQLRRAVSRICANITARTPHGIEGAAKALVSILEAVTARNYDPLDGNRWGRASFHGEDETQRNLYQVLIGSVDPDFDSSAELFVVDALDTLPSSDLRQFAEQLQAILRKIEINRAPRRFLIRLGALVRGAESAAAAPGTTTTVAGGSGQKRPAAGYSGGHTKRTR